MNIKLHAAMRECNQVNRCRKTEFIDRSQLPRGPLAQSLRAAASEQTRSHAAEGEYGRLLAFFLF